MSWGLGSLEVLGLGAPEVLDFVTFGGLEAISFSGRPWGLGLSCSVVPRPEPPELLADTALCWLQR